MTWTENVRAYLGTLNASTAIRYRAALDEFFTWYRQTYDEDPDPALLTDEEAREWRSHLSDVRKLRASTINVRLSALKGLARHCGRRIEVRGVRQVQPPIQSLTGRELGRLIAAAEGYDWGPEWLALRNVAIIGMMARAGLRVGELVALDVKDVELNPRSGWALVRQGKGLKERRVPLSAQTRQDLGAYLAARPEWASEALFVTKTGKRMNARSVQRLIKVAAQRAGITTSVTPHALRHTFATRFLQKNGDLTTLQALLGHSSIATTSRYLHPDATRMQEMVDEL